MELERVSETWTRWGDEDAMWAVLTDADKSGNRWSPEEFLATGVAEIETLLASLRSQGIKPAKGAALDFGCGAGRLSQALAWAGFGHVTGVDISAPMLDTARRLNQHGDRVTFLHNQSADLAVVPSATIDFVYTCRVLQHMPPEFAHGYIREFFRIATPGGVVVFQIPVRPKATPAGVVLRYTPRPLLNKLRKGMQMHGTSPAEVERLVVGAGGELLYSEADEAAGPRWESRLYVARRPT